MRKQLVMKAGVVYLHRYKHRQAQKECEKEKRWTIITKREKKVKMYKLIV